MRWWLLFIILSVSEGSHAAGAALPPAQHDSYFSRIPVLHEGRIKPLESFARAELRRFSGKEAKADAWLAAMLFDPGAMLETPMFRVTSPELRQALALPERKGNLYSLIESNTALEAQKELLARAMQTPEESLSPPERALLDLSAHVRSASALMRSFAPVLPLNIEVSAELRAELHLPHGELDYLTLARIRGRVFEDVKALVAAKGEAVEHYTPQEKEKSLMAFNLTLLESTGANNRLLRVLPSAWGADEWFSPWAMLLEGKAAPETGELLALWQQLAAAYQTGDAEAWRSISQQLYSAAPVAHWRIDLEHYYYALHLLEAAMALYALAFMLLLLRTRPKGGMTLLTLALLIHGALLVARMLILGRPPVSTLYESVLFVSFITAAAAFLWPGKNFRRERSLAGSALAALLLAISPVYAETGDTMGVLVAVLNTNFWLATHVVCITAGYGWCLIAGTLAHFWLFHHASAGRKLPSTPPGWMQSLALVALLFTTLGTILGGIWADQSWGRFWGWDPKENGALLIVLWLAWVLHGRVSGYFRSAGFAALLALVNVVVAISWFGTNLLGVGLHSYGFTSAAALGLAAFCMAEFLIIALAYGLARRHA